MVQQSQAEIMEIEEQLECPNERNRTMEKVRQVNSLVGLGRLSPLFRFNKIYAATWATIRNGLFSGSFDGPLSDIGVRLSCGSNHEICAKTVAEPQRNQINRALIMQIIDPVDDDDDSFELLEIVQSNTTLLVPINLKVGTEKATSVHWSFYSEPYGTKFELSYQGPFDKASQKANTAASVDEEPLRKIFGTATNESLTSFTISPLSESTPSCPNGSQSPETLISVHAHSHLKNVSGSLVPKNAGIYVFHFDNTKLSSSTKIFLKIKLVSKSIVSNDTNL